MEEILRRSQEKLREMFPAGGNGGGRGAALVVAAVFVLWLLSGIYKVQPEEQGVVMRFGEFHRVTDPGLRYHLPAPFEAVLKPPVTRVNMIEVGFRSNGSGTRDGQPRSIAEESMMLTGDENIIDINFKVQWKIRDAKQFLFNVRNPEVTVKNAAESAMRESIGQTPIASALSDGRLAIEQSAQGLLQNILNNYQAGIEVIGVQMLDVNPPAAVIDAFRDVQTAQADAERAINQAEAYANDILPKARGAAEQKTLDAQAYRQRVVAQSEGEAARFASIYNEYKNASAVTRQRLYIEAMEEVMKNTPKVVIDSSVKGLVPFLPLGEMMKKEAKGTTNE
jgi:membrane protease subunit HflK